MFTSSRDGGRTFSHPRAILHTGAIMFAVETLERANGFAQIAASAQRLYVTWSDYRNGDLDVFCASSADNGRTWTNAVRVNNDPIHNGADQFFQWLAVDPNDGAVNVMFYDAEAIRKTVSRSLSSRAQPTTAVPSPTTPGRINLSKPEAFSSWTTPDSRLSANVFTAHGRRSRAQSPVAAAKHQSSIPLAMARLSQWESPISLANRKLKR